MTDADTAAGLPDTVDNSDSATPVDSRGGLLSRSFVGLIITQFLGAMNDNTFRWLVVPIAKDYFDQNQIGNGELALSLGLACITLPFALLAAPAGYFSDRFSKRSVNIGCKVAEITIMTLGVGAIMLGNIYLLYGVLLLMGSQSAIFSPAKYGCIPEIVRDDRISSANGVIGLTTVLAIVFGGIAGNWLYRLTTPLDTVLPPGQYHWWISASVLIGTAGLGLGASLIMGRLKAANPTKAFSLDFAGQTIRQLATLGANRALLLTAFGVTFFWSLGALVNVNVDLFGEVVLRVPQEQIGPLLAALSLGIGAGSVLAGRLSAGKIDLGIVPVGAVGVAVASLMICTVPTGNGNTLSASYLMGCFWLFALGVGGGLYNVPLQAYLQYRSPTALRGSILAATNFITCSSMALVAGLFWLLTGPLGFSPQQVFLAAGVFTLPVIVSSAWLLPCPTARFLITRLMRFMYRVRVEGEENVPQKGGALLIPNHVSWADGPLIGVTCPRHMRFIVYAAYFAPWYIRWFIKVSDIIPIRPGKRSVVESIREARRTLQGGGLVGIFPEGSITPDGRMHEFRPGFLSALKHTDVPVIPVYVDGLWGSIFSRGGGRLFWRWPRRWFDPVIVRFGKPIPKPHKLEQIHEAVEELGEQVMADRERRRLNLPRRFLRMCRRNLFRMKVADSSGMELTGASLLMRTLILRRLLRRHVLDRDEQHVGLLLPNSVPAAVVNAALSIDRRIAANLNYTASSDVMNECIKQCGIRRVLTSRRVMEKLDHLKIDAELVYLEDFKAKVTLADKLIAAMQTWLMPSAVLERHLGLTQISPDDPLTVIFTSGTTGIPKGVVLTHHNVASNLDGFTSAIRLDHDDAIVGILPVFHSFGYTANLWIALALAPRVVFHFSPLEPRPIAKLCQKYKATVLIATPTFLRGYMRKCTPEEFSTLDVVLTGAERLPAKLADAFEKRFHLRPLQGYGTTELSPVVSLNVPEHRRSETSSNGSREGSIGQPIPGVMAKVVDLDTGEDLGPNQPGMLLIYGPNVMQGYYGRPDLTAEVLHDGWYTTGDVAKIDEDGFIFITDRLSRFSKIAGEMVPHVRIEEEINTVLHLDGETVRLVVTAIPDDRKGERLVVLHTGLDQPPEQIRKALAAAGLPPLWIPSPNCFRQIEQLPVLGTGKLDVKGIKAAALKEFADS